MGSKNMVDSTRIIITDESGNYSFSTLKDIAETKHYCLSTIRKRLANGMSLTEAITTPVGYANKKVIDPKTGKEMFLYEIAKRENIKIDTLHSRIFDLGWSIERAVNEPINTSKAKKEITSDIGDTYSYSTWDKILGFGRGTVSHRILREKTEQEAITTGIRNAIYFIDPKTNKPIPQDQVEEEDFIN